MGLPLLQLQERKMKKNKPFLSVILPLYNEEKRLKNLIRIYNFLNSIKKSYEVILVNDGSSDKTLSSLKSIPKKYKYKLISYEVNMGKGYAIKQGMLAANGSFRLFTDIDLSTPINEFNKFIPFLKKFDLIIGSRKTIGSTLKRRQPFIRESLGKVFTLISQMSLNLQTSDFTCGFKCFSQKAAQKIFKKQTINRWGFDSEILFLAKKLGFKTKEIPVIWTDDPRSKVKFPQAIISSLTDLVKIRLNNYS